MSSDISKEDKSIDQKNSGIELPKGVETTSDIPDGVSEDVYRFWKENGQRIIVYCVVALLAYLGVQGWKEFTASHEASIRKEFAGLESTEAKLKFAESHKNHALAAYAYLDAGKEAYESKDFVKAAEDYRKATEVLAKSQLQAVALMGEASCMRETGDEVGASQTLDRVINNEKFAEGIRAEAMFKRIVIALNDGQNDVVENLTDKLEAIDNSGIWAQRLDSIKYYQ